MSTPQNNTGKAAAAAGMGAGIVVALAVVGCMGVGMIGILAAIAIPNFLKFQCKSKQSEAKVNLSGIFTAQKSFYGEYNFYTTDLVSINWTPDGMPLYVYGFAEAGPMEENLPKSIAEVPRDYDPDRKDTASPDVISSTYSTTKMRDLSGKVLTGKDLPPDTTADASGFLAGAVGDVDVDHASPRLDIWTIDQNKTLRVISNDCTN